MPHGVVPNNPPRRRDKKPRRRGECDWNRCAAVSSSSCCTSDENDHSWNTLLCQTTVPPLMSSSEDDDSAGESSSFDGGRNSTSDTERWFGGPLKLLYRARRFQPFTDPILLFNRVFHSGFLPSGRCTLAPSAWRTNDCHTNAPGREEQNWPRISLGGTQLAPFVPATTDDTLPVLWEDGRTVAVAQRVQSPYAGSAETTKTVTRTVTRFPPELGKRRTVIQVTSEYSTPTKTGLHRMDDASFQASNMDCAGWIPWKSGADRENDHSRSSFCHSWLPFC